MNEEITLKRARRIESLARCKASHHFHYECPICQSMTWDEDGNELGEACEERHRLGDVVRKWFDKGHTVVDGGN